MICLNTEDLSGIKVGHDLEDFEEGEHILTLKDSRILDGDGTSSTLQPPSPRSLADGFLLVWLYRGRADERGSRSDGSRREG